MGDTNDGAVRDAKKLGLPKVLILGLQHMFAMFGATILVPILVSGYFADACGEPLTRGLTVSVTLFCAGFGTLLFHVCSKFKVPAFLGSSFAFLGGFSTVANLDTGKFADMAANDKVAYACGGVVAAGALYLVMALIIKLVGVNRVMRFLPPVVTGPIIICIGLSLAPSAISNASTNWWLAVIALAVIIIFNIWGKGMFKIIPILMGVLISYVAAVIMNAAGLTNPDGSAIIALLIIPTCGPLPCVTTTSQPSSIKSTIALEVTFTAAICSGSVFPSALPPSAITILFFLFILNISPKINKITVFAIYIRRR